MAIQANLPPRLQSAYAARWPMRAAWSVWSFAASMRLQQRSMISFSLRRRRCEEIEQRCGHGGGEQRHEYEERVKRRAEDVLLVADAQHDELYDTARVEQSANLRGRTPADAGGACRKSRTREFAA